MLEPLPYSPDREQRTPLARRGPATARASPPRADPDSAAATSYASPASAAAQAPPHAPRASPAGRPAPPVAPTAPATPRPPARGPVRRSPPPPRAPRPLFRRLGAGPCRLTCASPRERSKNGSTQGRSGLGQD